MLSIFQSKYIPKILAVWGVFTYLSMLGLAFTNILLPDRPAVIEIVIYTLGTFFELIFGFWLVVKGLNVQQRNNHVFKSAQTYSGLHLNRGQFYPNHLSNWFAYCCYCAS